MKRVLITGSQGSLGSILRQGLRDSFLLSCIDVVASGETTITIDLAREYNKLKKIAKNQDAIVHLAWDTREDYPNENIVPANKTMAENMYRAAVEVGVPRVIVASSVHANDYSKVNAGDELSASAESYPDTPYGATKKYIESLGRFYANKYSLEVICPRFGGINKNNEVRFEEDPLYDKVLFYKEDFVNLVSHCLTIKAVPNNFCVFYAVSNVKGRLHSLENSLNWKPSFFINETN